VFCHEWCQVGNGTIEYAPLAPDFASFTAPPKRLLDAKSAMPGAGPVTDGPFFYRTSQNRLVMIWSSVVGENYCEAMAYSSDNTLMGKWTNDERLLFEKDGGHGMIFRDNDGKLLFICHQPNDTPNERPVLFELAEENDSFRVK